MLLVALLVLVVQAPFPSIPSNANVISRMALVEAIVEEGHTRIDARQEMTIDKAYANGHYYSDKAPGMSLLAVPAYAVASSFFEAVGYSGIDPFRDKDDRLPDYYGGLLMSKLMVLSTSGLFTILASLALYRVSLPLVRGDPVPAAMTALTMALATPMLFWGIEFFGHAAAGGALFVAFASIWLMRERLEEGRRGAGWLAALAGLMMALAIAVEYISAPVCVLIGAYGVWQCRDLNPAQTARLLILAVGACIIGILPLLYYHTVTFGGPFTVGYDNLEGWEGMDEGFHGLTAPDPGVLYQIIFSQYRGILWLSPILALVPVGAVMLWRRMPLYRVEIGLCVLVMVYYLLLNSSYYYWHGGGSTGPRHITPALPFMALLLIPLWRDAGRFMSRVAAVLFALGAAACLAVVNVNHLAGEDQPFPLWDPVILGLFQGNTMWYWWDRWYFDENVIFALWLLASGGVAFLLIRRLRSMGPEDGGDPGEA
ncbi:MAG: hypothetical protein AAGA15_00065 [Pseudomonadota bacterium]